MIPGWMVFVLKPHSHPFYGASDLCPQAHPSEVCRGTIVFRKRSVRLPGLNLFEWLILLNLAQVAEKPRSRKLERPFRWKQPVSLRPIDEPYTKINTAA